jgi:hypothetical protein
MKKLREQTSKRIGGVAGETSIGQFDMDANREAIKNYCFTQSSNPTIQNVIKTSPPQYVLYKLNGVDVPALKVVTPSGNKQYTYIDKGIVTMNVIDSKGQQVSGYPRIFQECQSKIGLNQGQINIVNDLAEKQGYTNVFPGEALIGKTFKAVDLNTLYPDNFPIPNIHYVFQQTGLRNELINQYPEVEKDLKAVGYTFKTPPIGSSRYSAGKGILNVLTDDKYKSMFPNGAGKEGTPKVYPSEEGSTIKVNKNTVSALIKNYKSNNVSRGDCKSAIKLLYHDFNNPGDPYIVDTTNEDGETVTADAQIIAIKNTIKLCNRKNFIGSIFGVKDELETLKSKSSKVNKYGMADMLRESDDIKLKNIVREHLIRLSESNKKKILDESKIAKKRFNVIIDNNSVKTKKQKNKFTTEVIKEIRVLNDMGFSQRSINEGLFDSIGSIFGSAGEGILEMIKENFADWIIRTLTPMDPDGWLATLIKVSFGNLPVSDLGKLTDCGFLTSYLAKDIVETIGAKGQSKMGLEGGGYDFLRNAIFDAMDKSELGQKIQGGLSNMLCNKLPSIQSKMDDVQAKFKEGALQAATK